MAEVIGVQTMSVQYQLLLTWFVESNISVNLSLCLNSCTEFVREI